MAPIATPCFWGRVFSARVEEAAVTTLCDPTMGCSGRGARVATGSCPSSPGTTARCSAYRCQCEAWVARSHHRGRRRHQRSKVILHKHPTAAAPDSEEVAGSPMNLPSPLRLLQQPRRVSFTLPMSAHQLSMADQRDDAAAPRLGSPAPQAMQQLQDGRRVRVPVDDVAQ